MSILAGRQNEVVGEDPDFVYDGEPNFWWTREGQIIRWAMFVGIFFLFIAYMLGGHWHAKRRISKGLPPLAYHRWLLSRQQRARFDPYYQNPQVYYNEYPPPGMQYGMNPMPPAPAYDHNAPPPPTYQPPAGATKVDPSQWRSEPTRRPADTTDPSPSYDAPPGPPPTVHPNHTGASDANNPYRL